MAVSIGNDVGLYVNNQLIGCLTENSVSLGHEQIETTCKDNNGARTFVLGGETGSFSFNGNFNPSSTYGFEDLLGIKKNKTRVGLKQYDTVSGLYISGYGYLLNLDWSGPLNAATVFTGTFDLDGEWSYGTAS